MNTGITSSSKGKVALGVILVTMFLFAFVYVQPAAACWQTLQQGTYQNISVQVAHRMIERDHNNQILILDVRYQCEYDMGHLYGAVLIPYDQLQARISELQAYKNQAIIVYCKTGVRSTIASEILANNSFTRVYNMVGGIFAWINTGYQIYTTYHYATVNVVDGEALMHIEPLLLLQTGPAPCTQNKTCSGGSNGGNITNFQSTVLEQDENHTLTRITYEVNGTTFEFTAANTLLWSYNEVTDEYNRTARFTSTEITEQNSFAQFYSLGYFVRHSEYNFTVYTVLRPSGSGAYDSAFTFMNYAPAGKSEVVSLELVQFNTSVTLSSQYTILRNIAKAIGKLYEKSEDKSLTQLAPRYSTMGEEAKYLSKLVKEHLQQYDMPIASANTLMMDDIWSCIACFGICLVGVYAFAVACCALTVVCCQLAYIIYTLDPMFACHLLCEAVHWCP